MDRRIAVPLVAAVGCVALTTALEATRRGGSPTGAAIGALPFGAAVLPEPPLALIVAMAARQDTGRRAPAHPEKDTLVGRYVVRFADDLQVDDPAAWAADVGLSLEVERPLARPRPGGRADPLENTWTVSGSESLARELGERDEVVLVEPLYRTRASGLPNDPYYGYQWNLSTLAVPDGWEVTKGRGVVVAVLDTGASPGPDGLSLLLNGYDFVDDDPDPSDSGWHGTHVSGVIAQATDNGEGVASVAPSAAILPVRVLGEDGGNTADLAEGIVWAVSEGADVINLSLGSMGESELVLEALAYAEEEGVVVVAASGNDSYTDYVQFPASVDTVLAVGAVLMDGSIATYSNQGEDLDLVAPGGTIDEDADGDGLPDGVLQEAWYEGDWSYIVAEGTSVATPHVAAVAALLIAAGDLDPAEVRSALRSSAIDLGDEGHDDTFGHGLLDPVGALDAAGLDAGGADPADGDDDDEDLGSGSGGSIRPNTGDTVSLAPDEGGTLGCGG